MHNPHTEQQPVTKAGLPNYKLLVMEGDEEIVKLTFVADGPLVERLTIVMNSEIPCATTISMAAVATIAAWGRLEGEGFSLFSGPALIKCPSRTLLETAFPTINQTELDAALDEDAELQRRENQTPAAQLKRDLAKMEKEQKDALTAADDVREKNIQDLQSEVES
jgi:hypothetical protein